MKAFRLNVPISKGLLACVYGGILDVCPRDAVFRGALIVSILLGDGCARECCDGEEDVLFHGTKGVKITPENAGSSTTRSRFLDEG